MTAEERIAQLEQENAQLRAELAEARQQIAQLAERLHQVEGVRCPHCQQRSLADFPPGVEAPVQYGPNVRALAVYLHQYQLVPLARTCELLADLCECHLSEGTLTSWVELAATMLKETVERIADWLSASRLTHGDET